MMRRAVVSAVFAPALALAVAAAAGCTHFHRPWNAPGIVDVRTPPTRAVERDQPEWPGDPGERYVSLTYGAFSGIGAVIDGGASLLGAVGVEVSLHRGTSPHSHNEDDFFIFPVKWEGLNLGWTAVNYDGDDNIEVGPIYLEAQRAETGGGIAVGLAFDPNDVAVGPQVTLFFASLYLRADYLIGVGPSATAGWIFKLPTSWVWSQ